MSLRRAFALAALVSLAFTASVSAHGIGGRGDLPIPKGYYVWSAACVVVVSFVWSVVGWRRATLSRLAGGHPLQGWTATATHWFGPLVRVLGFEFFVVVILSGWFGSTESGENLAPVSLYVVLWVGVLWLSALLGGVWRVLNPWDSVAALWSRGGSTPDPHPQDRSLVWSHWPAAAALGVFVWLELAYHEPASPRVVALYLTLYTGWVLAMAAKFGRRWIQTGEGFTVLFGLVAAMSPIRRTPAGRLTLRLPVVGLARLETRRGTLAVVLVVLGGTTFDGVTRTSWWGEIVRLSAGWERTFRATLGLALTVAAVAAAYWLAAAIGDRLTGHGIGALADGFTASMIPIALAYSVAHYFSLLAFEGQSAYRLISDPLGRGWDLFGTAGHQIDYLWLTTGAIAAVVTLAMVVGHVAGIALAHDRAIQSTASRRQAMLASAPMAAVMVAFTIVGLTLLLSV